LTFPYATLPLNPRHNSKFQLNPLAQSEFLSITLSLKEGIVTVFAIFLETSRSGVKYLIRILSRLAIAFLILFIVMTDGGNTAKKRNTLTDIVPVAQLLVKSQPKPVWQTTFQADETDIVQFISKNRLLIGMLQLSSQIGNPKFGDIALYDTTSGKRLWQSPRKALLGGNYGVLITQPLILLQGLGPKVSYYSGIDPATGLVKWEYKVKKDHRIGIDRSGKLLFIMQKKSRDYQISALPIADGKTTWNQTLRKSGSAKLSDRSITIDKDSVYITAKRLFRLSLKSGAIIWSAPSPLAAGELSIVSVAGGVLLWDNESFYSIDPQTGKSRWGPLKLAGRIMSVSLPQSSTNRAFVTTRSIINKKKGFYTEAVHALDLAKGKKIWTSPAALQSGLLYDSGRVYFTETSDKLVALDASSGKPLLKVDMPVSGTSPLPDVLVPLKGTIVVAKQKRGVAAFSKSKGEFIWAQYQKSFESALFWYETRKKVLAKYEQVTKSSEEALKADARWWGNWTASVQYQWSGYQADPGKRSASTGSFGNSMVLFQSSLALSSLLKAGIMQSVLEGLVERQRLWVANSVKVHARSIQGHYYVRPYTKRGEGVMVVDLKTGKRADLIYSAPNKGMKTLTMRMPLFTIDPDNNRLLTTGISLDSSNYKRYTKVTFEMPYPSLLSIDLSSVKFRKQLWDDSKIVSAAGRGKTKWIEGYLKEGLWIDSTDNSGETALIKAAYKGHLETVKMLVASGANLNAKDNTHSTALLKAGEKGHADVLRLLIDAGADVNSVDKYGKTVLQAVKFTYELWHKKDVNGIIEMLEKAGAK
jgi:outer membrane protein assembly factor BamB